MASWPNYISVTWETISADACRKQAIREIFLIEKCVTKAKTNVFQKKNSALAHNFSI